MKSPPPSTASYIAVRDVTNDWPLYEKAPDTSYDYPASLEKMMTAYILLDRKSSVLDSETVTITSADVTITGSSADLMAGDVITWRDLLYGLMVPSGNDAAQAIARVIGTEIHDAAGSGTTGMTRFIEEMNNQGAVLGLSSTTFNSPSGGDNASEFPTGHVSPTTARDMTTLAGIAFADSDIQAAASAASHTMTITGTNARTYSVSSTVYLVNGPLNSPAGIKMDGLLAIKGGVLVGGPTTYNFSMLWEAPAGQQLAITIMGSPTDLARILDLTSLVLEIVDDYPYLVTGVSIGSDANIADVVALVGGESGYVDESSYARTVTNNGASLDTSDPAIGTQSFSFNGTNSRIEMADAAELSFGSGDWAVEFYFKGGGSEPGSNIAQVSKWDTTGNQREWAVFYDATNHKVSGSVSTTGSDFLEAKFTMTTSEALFNGAKRHILLRCSSGNIAIYVNGQIGEATIAPGALFAGTSKTLIGARETGGSSAEWFFSGKIGEVRVTKGDPRQTAGMFTPTGRAYPRS